MAWQPTLFDPPRDPAAIAAAQAAAATAIGMPVWQRSTEGEWWSPTTEVMATPPDWRFLRAGDTQLTKAVRALGPWWKVLQRNGYGTGEIGIVAPAANIEQVAAPLRELRDTRARARLGEDIDELVRLAAHPDVDVRTAVAANPHTPPQLLGQLLGAKARKVSEAAAVNPNLPEHLRVIVTLASTAGYDALRRSTDQRQ